jgi:hypothetical protein
MSIRDAGACGRATHRRTVAPWALGVGAVRAFAALLALALVVLAPAVASLAEHFVSSMATAALFTVMMDRCRRPGMEATDYTVQAALYAGFSGAVASVSGVVAQALGYGPHFALCAGVSVAGALIAVAVVGRGEPPPAGTRTQSSVRADPR